MNSLIYLFKELYAYCTDFIINLANITGLSYYEVNFIIFIIVYPFLLFASPVLYIIQKSRLNTIKIKSRTTVGISNFYSFKNIKTFNKRKIFVSANLAWLLVIGLGTLRVFLESTNYCTYHQLRGDYPTDADSISIPIFRETFFTFLILSILIILLNIFIFLTTFKANLPTKLFVKADNYNRLAISWELFFGFWLLVNILFFINWFWKAYFIESIVTLFFTFILLSLRAGQISKYKQTCENASP